MAKGKKTGGRQKGTPNQATRDMRATIEETFDRAGGVPALVRWAKRNPGLFYTKIWAKLLPKDVNVSGTLTLEDLVAGSMEKEKGGER